MSNLESVASKELIGRPVITLQLGERLGTINDPIFDRCQKQVIGYGVHLKGWLKGDGYIGLSDISALGPDAVIINSKEKLQDALVLSDGQTTEEYVGIYDMHVITQEGEQLGNVEDFIFNPQTGQVSQYILSDGLLRGLVHGRRIIAAQDILTVGKDVLVACGNPIVEEKPHKEPKK